MLCRCPQLGLRSRIRQCGLSWHLNQNIHQMMHSSRQTPEGMVCSTVPNSANTWHRSMHLVVWDEVQIHRMYMLRWLQ